MSRYVAFLRGINVGGHHKVPMAELRDEMKKMGFKNVLSLLNSGNIIFDGYKAELDQLEKMISQHLEKVFGFPIPTLLREADMIHRMIESNPFAEVVITKDIRLYVSFLRHAVNTKLSLPWTNEDKSFRIIKISDKTILSVLDLSISNTPKGMGNLEKTFGSDITTRNWNTIKRIKQKLDN